MSNCSNAFIQTCLANSPLNEEEKGTYVTIGVLLCVAQVWKRKHAVLIRFCLDEKPGFKNTQNPLLI
jgi:hypothetical protein